DVLAYWQRTGIAGHQIGAYASLDVLSMDHVRCAVNLFGGVYIGAALPLSAQSQTVWDVVDGPSGESGTLGGHAMAVVAYTPTGPVFVTWGALKIATWAWWAKYVDEAYALIAPEWVSGGITAPSGFNIVQLQADLAA